MFKKKRQPRCEDFYCEERKYVLPEVKSVQAAPTYRSTMSKTVVWPKVILFGDSITQVSCCVENLL